MPVDVQYDLAADELPDLFDLYATYDWWADRDPAAFRRAVEATDAFVCLRDTETDELLAAARVLTDFVYYATVFDVIVHGDHRGEGLGRKLMAAVSEHPELQDLKRLNLFSRTGLVPFYEACGFERSAMEAPVPELGGETEDLVYMVYEME